MEPGHGKKTRFFRHIAKRDPANVPTARNQTVFLGQSIDGHAKDRDNDVHLFNVLFIRWQMVYQLVKIGLNHFHIVEAIGGGAIATTERVNDTGGAHDCGRQI